MRKGSGAADGSLIFARKDIYYKLEGSFMPLVPSEPLLPSCSLREAAQSVPPDIDLSCSLCATGRPGALCPGAARPPGPGFQKSHCPQQQERAEFGGLIPLAAIPIYSQL